MDAPQAKFPFSSHGLLALASVALLSAAACAPTAPAPTAAPAKAAPTAAAAPPAPTAAPPKAEAPAPKPAATAAPAAKPTEKPAAKAAEFDEKAVADFYKGKTVRIVLGFGPGGATDVNARLVQKVLPKYIPGNPTIVVENKPGGGGMLAANTISNSEPKDGTVIAGPSNYLVVQQAIGAKGVQFDAAKMQWLASTYATVAACAARMDSGITSIQDVMEGGKELAVGSWGKGSQSYDPPAVMNAALGTRLKIVTGYESGATVRQAQKTNEVQGSCTTLDDFGGLGRDMFEGQKPLMKLIVIIGPEPPSHPLFDLKAVPAAEKLAKTDEARALVRLIHLPNEISLPFVAAPEVPRDRIQALRRAFDKVFVDPEFIAAAEKVQQSVSPRTGEEVTRVIQAVLGAPPAVLAKLKEVLE